MAGHASQQIRTILSGFASDENGFCWTGAFVNFHADLTEQVRRGALGATPQQLVSHLDHVVHDVANIGALLERLAWTKGEQVAGRLWLSTWSRFAELDIEHFHLEIRSAMDY